MKYATYILTAAFCLTAAMGCTAGDNELVQGNWSAASGSGFTISAKIIADGSGRYHAIVDASGAQGVVTGETKRKKTVFEGKLGSDEFKMKVADGKAKGHVGTSDFMMTRIEEKSPTLGAKPPQDAIVLLDGVDMDAWQNQKPGGPLWNLVDGAMEVKKAGNILTKEQFGDALYHIEFRTPFMPRQRGQARGNSGVYIQGRYEVQVLDSFGLPPADNECGGIYKMAVPKVNACLPPTEWQTYDITFTAPKFDASGEKTQNARITVLQNGIAIHDNVELSGSTPGGVAQDEAAAGPLLLQDHGNKVQYRNIWVKKN